MNCQAQLSIRPRNVPKWYLDEYNEEFYITDLNKNSFSGRQVKRIIFNFEGIQVSESFVAAPGLAHNENLKVSNRNLHPPINEDRLFIFKYVKTLDQIDWNG